LGSSLSSKREVLRSAWSTSDDTGACSGSIDGCQRRRRTERLLLKELLLLLLVLFRTGSYLSVLFIEDTDYTGCDFMVNYGFVVLANNVNAKFL